VALLETDQLSVTFGGLTAVDRLSIKVEEGQLVGLITLDALADHLVDVFDDDQVSISEAGWS